MNINCLKVCILFFAISLCNKVTKIYAQLGIVVDGGLNLSTIVDKTSTTDYRVIEIFKPIPSLRGSINVDVGLTEHIYLYTGIGFINSKFHSKRLDTIHNIELENRYKLNQFQIPLIFNYKTAYEGDGRFWIGLGPFINITPWGINSKDVIIDVNGTNEVIHDKKSIIIEKKDDPESFRKAYWGIKGNLGYEFPAKVYIKSDFAYSLSDIKYGGMDKINTRGWSFSMTLGIYLKQIKHNKIY